MWCISISEILSNMLSLAWTNRFKKEATKTREEQKKQNNLETENSEEIVVKQNHQFEVLYFEMKRVR